MSGQRSLLSIGLSTLGLRAVSLLVNVLGGIAVARGLEEDGRGAYAAVMIGASVTSVFFSIGAVRAISFFRARDPDRGDALLSSWAVLLLVSGGVGVLALNAALPHLVAAQDRDTLHLARLWSLTVFGALAYQLGSGALLGDGRFTTFNVIAVAQQAAASLLLVGLAATRDMTLTNALLATAVAYNAGAIGSVLAAIHGRRLAPPDRRLAGRTALFGLQTIGMDLGGSTNARLDALLVPAFLGAGAVGYYAVASNVAWMIVTVTSSLSLIALPVAARAGDKASERAAVIALLHLTLVASSLIAVVAAAVSPWLLPRLYGESFTASVQPLRILLPGTVLFAGALVLLSGINASGRAILTLWVQIPALAVTIAGMAIALPNEGVAGAAWVSTASYALMFATALAVYVKTSDQGWREVLIARRMWQAQSSRVAALLQRRPD